MAEPLGHLQNFRGALETLSERYAQLLSDDEWTFLHGFANLPQPSQCLLTRMLMRKGAYFRRPTLEYDEVGDLEAAIASLVEMGWLDVDPVLTLEHLHQILLREEWRRTFRHFARPGSADGPQLALPYVSEPPAAKPLSQWNADLANCAVHLLVQPVARRLQWLYFGNDGQTWDQFVLSDLGLRRYEQVPVNFGSCAFHNRGEIEHFYRLHECRERLRVEEPAASILERSECPAAVPDWLHARFCSFHLRVGARLERDGSYELALKAYRRSGIQGQVRVIRLKEAAGLHAAARDEAELALQQRCSEGQREEIGRALTRLSRRLGDRVAPTKRPIVQVMQLSVPKSGTERVERSASKQLSSEECQTFYVENSLFPAMFGLLCWEAIFAPLPGAFFHPFQSGPADLYTAQFRSRRSAQFDALLGLLDSNQYEAVIWRHYREKAGLSCDFVRWGRLKPEVLSLALRCIAPLHLRVIFERMLTDLDNCNGLPDLVQFWPAERRYRLVEVKAPGDRLQYNQRRWMQFFSQHDIPAVVCKVTPVIQ